MGTLDTLFERLKFPNPTEAAQRLTGWQQEVAEREMAAKASAAEGEATSPKAETQQARKKPGGGGGI